MKQRSVVLVVVGGGGSACSRPLLLDLDATPAASGLTCTQERSWGCLCKYEDAKEGECPSVFTCFTSEFLPLF